MSDHDIPDLLKDFFLSEYGPATLDYYMKMLESPLAHRNVEYVFNSREPEKWIISTFSWNNIPYWDKIHENWLMYLGAL